MPAEWEEHAATWLAWPHNRTDWPGKFQPIPWVYAEIVRNLARGERVEILAQDTEAADRARAVLDRSNTLSDNVHFRRCVTNRGWVRDSAPIFLRRDNRRDPVAAVNFQFNAWAKYPDWRHDCRASEQVLRWLKFPAWRPTAPNGRLVVLEGGSIDVNGRGLLLTTEECLLSPVQQRNPGLTREQLERVLADYLGIEKVLWLERGIAGDDTHGHIDDIARFVTPDTVIAAVEPNSADENHEALLHNFNRLRSMTDQHGHRLQVIPLPMPAPVVFRGHRLPASYANFYVANGRVLAPVFNDKHDRLALNLLEELFPDRDIVPIYCGDLIWGLGAIHCMTQQQPA
jgi:agmatine deiminase